MGKPLLLLSLLLITQYLLAEPVFAEPAVALYQPSYKNAQELKSAIKELYKDEISISTEDGLLLLRGEEKSINQIQELLLQLDREPQVYYLTISNSKQSGQTYSTDNLGQQQQFRVSEGETIYLVQQQTERVLQQAGWITATQEQVSQGQALALTVYSAIQTVNVDYVFQGVQNKQLTRKQNRVEGTFGEWLAIAEVPEDDSEKTYRTRKSSQGFYLKVIREADGP